MFAISTIQGFVNIRKDALLLKLFRPPMGDAIFSETWVGPKGRELEDLRKLVVPLIGIRVVIILVG